MQLHKWTARKTFKSICASCALVVFLVSFLFSTKASAEAWSYHNGRLTDLTNQLKEHERSIKTLLEEKRAITDEKALQSVLAELANRHKELQRVAKDYEEERLHVRFKHPDRHDTTERQYLRYQVKTLKELENELGLDGRLDRLKVRVTRTFPAPEVVATPPPSKARTDIFRKPASTIYEEEAPEKIHLVK